MKSYDKYLNAHLDLLTSQRRSADLLKVSKLPRTPWFNGNLNPSRPGVYLTREEFHQPWSETNFQYFNGKLWHRPAASIDWAYNLRETAASVFCKPAVWMGMLK